MTLLRFIHFFFFIFSKGIKINARTSRTAGRITYAECNLVCFGRSQELRCSVFSETTFSDERLTRRYSTAERNQNANIGRKKKKFPDTTCACTWVIKNRREKHATRLIFVPRPLPCGGEVTTACCGSATPEDRYTNSARTQRGTATRTRPAPNVRRAVCARLAARNRARTAPPLPPSRGRTRARCAAAAGLSPTLCRRGSLANPLPPRSARRVPSFLSITRPSYSYENSFCLIII